MRTHEQLQELIPHIKILHADMPGRLYGLTLRNEIYLNTNLRDSYHETEILAEEVAHILISNGDISDYSSIKNMKDELRARRMAHQLLVPLDKLVECFKLGMWGDIYEMCLHLEIDRSYFEKVIDEYKSIFGLEVIYKNYLISFEPLKIIERG